MGGLGKILIYTTRAHMRMRSGGTVEFLGAETVLRWWPCPEKVNLTSCLGFLGTKMRKKCKIRVHSKDYLLVVF